MLDDRDYMRPPQQMSRNTGLSATLIIIIITVVFFLIKEGTRDFAFLDANGYAFTLFKKPEPAVKFEAFWQIIGAVSYIFMHANKTHIFWNMFGTYIFGSHLEQVIGKGNFVRLYLGSGVIAGIIWFTFRFDPGALMGASGALFGIMIAAALITPDLQMLLFFVIPVRLKWFATGYLIITLFMLNDKGQTSHLAHLGGAIGGIILTMAFHKAKVRWFPLAFLFKSTGPTKKKYSNGYKKPDLHVVNDEPIDSATVDKILDKIGKYGMKSLTAKEKRQLEQARKRFSKQ